MYEPFFGFERRPFTATPDARCFVDVGTIQPAFDALSTCIHGGQGIGIVTGQPGTGKTLLCQRLHDSVKQELSTLHLSHARFPTRRGFLQTLLYQLNQPYASMEEQELRLQLHSALRDRSSGDHPLVLIIDEAHDLQPAQLEDIRVLADLAESGKPLVRVVLAGQFQLEHALAAPQLAAFNQRIRCQVALESLTRNESAAYVEHRLQAAGADPDTVFTSDALDAIASYSDGLPRCLNQLADHALLLAYIVEERPVSADVVRDAVDDLRQLPLQWNIPPEEFAHSSNDETDAGDAVEFGTDDAQTTTIDDAADVTPTNPTADVDTEPQPTEGTLEAPQSVEFSWDDEQTVHVTEEWSSTAPTNDHSDDSADRLFPSAEWNGDSWGQSEPAGGTPITIHAADEEAADGEPTTENRRTAEVDGFTEEPLVDRYARLQAGLPVEQEETASADENGIEEPSSEPSVGVLHEATPEQTSPSDDDWRTTGTPEEEQDLEHLVGGEVFDLCLETQLTLGASLDASDSIGMSDQADMAEVTPASVFDIVQAEMDDEEDATATAADRTSQLFSELRRRQDATGTEQ